MKKIFSPEIKNYTNNKIKSYIQSMSIGDKIYINDLTNLDGFNPYKTTQISNLIKKGVLKPEYRFRNIVASSWAELAGERFATEEQALRQLSINDINETKIYLEKVKEIEE